MAEHAAYLVSRLEVGTDGKTAHKECRGKRAKVMAIEFGEKNRLQKLNPRWEHGVFVAVTVASGEMWVATKENLQAVRSVESILAGERWNQNNKDFVKHVPWDKCGESPGAETEPERLPSTRRWLHAWSSTQNIRTPRVAQSMDNRVPSKDKAGAHRGVSREVLRPNEG